MTTDRSVWALALCLAIASVAGGAGPDDTLRDAAEHLARFSFHEAHARFAVVADEAPVGSPLWRQAMYGKALAAWHQTPPTWRGLEEARTTLQRLLDVAPDDSALAPRVMLQLGRMAEIRNLPDDQVDLPTARQWYQRVIDRWPDDPIAAEAILRLAGSFIQVHDDEASVRRGVAILDDWLGAHADHPLATAAWQYLGDTWLLTLKEPARALACYRQADALGLAAPELAGALYWRMAVLAERTGQWSVAIDCYRKIITDTARTGRTYEAQLALRRLQRDHPELDVQVPPLVGVAEAWESRELEKAP